MICASRAEGFVARTGSAAEAVSERGGKALESARTAAGAGAGALVMRADLSTGAADVEVLAGALAAGATADFALERGDGAFAGGAFVSTVLVGVFAVDFFAGVFATAAGAFFAGALAAGLEADFFAAGLTDLTAFAGAFVALAGAGFTAFMGTFATGLAALVGAFG